MAESELAVLSTQCASIAASPDKAHLIAEVAAWEKRRNTLYPKADWQFTTADVRSHRLSSLLTLVQATCILCKALA